MRPTHITVLLEVRTRCLLAAFSSIHPVLKHLFRVVDQHAIGHHPCLASVVAGTRPLAEPRPFPFEHGGIQAASPLPVLTGDRSGPLSSQRFLVLSIRCPRLLPALPPRSCIRLLLLDHPSFSPSFSASPTKHLPSLFPSSRILLHAFAVAAVHLRLFSIHQSNSHRRSRSRHP
ncbi:hypothetical protein VTI28DRAFT_3631 [Corynascus sepedonium]